MKPKYNEENHKDLDQGWAWVIMVAAACASVLIAMLVYSVGVIHVALLEQFEEDNAYTSLTGSMFSSLSLLLGPVSSMLINVFSCRVTMIVGGVTLFVGLISTSFAPNNLNYIFITYGIVAGIGVGLCATSSLVVIGYFFHRKRGLALAVVVSGSGIGMFIGCPLVQELINEYGFHGAFMVLAAITSNHVVLGALMRPSNLEYKHKEDMKQKADSSSNENLKTQPYSWRNILHFDILLDKAFIFCNMQYFIWNIPYGIIVLHLTNFVVLQGATKEDAALLITYVGIGSVFGRVVTGLCIGHNGLDPVLVNFGFTVLVSLITFLFPLYSRTPEGQITFSVLFGVYSGGLGTMVIPLCSELVGVAKISSAVGIMHFIGGLGYFIGPPMAGLIIDNNGKYEDNFYLCGGLYLLASVFTLISNTWRVTSS